MIKIFFYLHTAPPGARVSPSFEYELRRGVMDGAAKIRARLVIAGPDFNLPALVEEGAWRRFDGALGVVPTWARDSISNWDKLQSKLPAITLTGASNRTGAHRIDGDHRHEMGLILNHLKQAGYTRLGYVGMDTGHHADSRYLAFIESSISLRFLVAPNHVAAAAGAAQRKHPLPLRLKPLSTRGDDPGYLTGAQAATLSWLKSLGAHRPEVLVCESDRVAWILHRACQGLGLRVPQDLALTGFDDQQVAFEPWGYNTLTTVRQDFAAMGALGVELLADLIQSPKRKKPLRVTCPGTLVVRHSTVLATGAVAEGPSSFSRLSREHLEAHFTEGGRLDGLCDKLKMPAPVFRRQFRREIGTTVAGYLRTLQVEKALFLLRHTQKPVSLIWPEVGFHNHQYFLTAFKRHTGFSPLEWRRKNV